MGEIARNAKMVKEIKLTIDGHEYTAYLSDKDVCKIITNKTGYERIKQGERYFFDDGCGDIDDNINIANINYDECYNLAGCYSSREIARNNVRADTLMRRMRQWQALNDDVSCWDCYDSHYTIYFDYDEREILVSRNDLCRHFGQIYFSSEKRAIEAIKVFYSDLIWYFTEYQQRLDEPKHK